MAVAAGKSSRQAEEEEAMRIVSDGTPKGTFVYYDDGEAVRGIVALQRKDGKWYVTTRRTPSHESIETEGIPEGDFFVAVSPGYQQVRV